MLANIIYTIFFVGLNSLLYLLFVRNLKLKVSTWILIGVGIILTLITHSKLALQSMMSLKEYSALLQFSFSLVLLQVVAKFQMKLAGFVSSSMTGTNKKLRDFMLKIYDFMLKKVIL